MMFTKQIPFTLIFGHDKLQVVMHKWCKKVFHTMSKTPGIFEKNRDLEELKNDKEELPKFLALPK